MLFFRQVLDFLASTWISRRFLTSFMEILDFLYSHRNFINLSELHKNFRFFRLFIEISYISPELSGDFRFLKFYVEIFVEISGIFIEILQIPARFAATLEILGTRMIICRMYGCRVVFFVALYIFSYVSYFHPFDRSFILQSLNLALWGGFSWERFEELQYNIKENLYYIKES